MKRWLLWGLLLLLFLSGCSVPIAVEEEEGAFIPVGSATKYEELVSAYNDSYGYVTEEKAAEDSAESEGLGGGGDYSETNVQVEGVDEGDIVKTDGEYIYRAVNNRIYIVKATEGEMEQVKTITLKENDYIIELYVDAERLIAVCNNYFYPHYDEEDGYDRLGTEILVYDLKDKENITLSREIMQEGNFISARKVGDCFYLITSQYPYYIMEDQELPIYRDSVAGETTTTLSYDQIYYPAGTESLPPNQLLVGAVDLAASDPIAINSYMGAGETVYMNEESLYIVANNGYWGGVVLEDSMAIEEESASEEGVTEGSDTNESDRDEGAAEDMEENNPDEGVAEPDENSSDESGSEDGEPDEISPDESVTNDTDTSEADEPVSADDTVETLNESMLYAFDIAGATVTARANCTLPGRVLNQFSMDEYDGHFRIATTVWKSNGESDNRVYILDRDLKTTGSLTELAPGETIYSARFMGEKAYLVTFEQTDPLFVLDLSDPAAPAVLGELKIPGYSGYLHPYDETHLIGIGKEVVLTATDWSVDPVPLDQGMKIALFDVSDMENPQEVYSLEIGDRGTDSDALWNHKAFLFDKEKNLLVLPISVYTIQSGGATSETYGEFTKQGSYIFHLDAENIKLEQVISHNIMTGEKTISWESYIDRNLYICNILYALSSEKITSLDLETMEEISTLTLK